jgi:hypothetical protein
MKNYKSRALLPAGLCVVSCKKGNYSDPCLKRAARVLRLQQGPNSFQEKIGEFVDLPEMLISTPKQVNFFMRKPCTTR